jgi:competence protein ComEC
LIKLRTLLLFDYLYIVLAIVIFVFCLISTNLNIVKSKYNGNETNIVGYIHNINIDGDKLTLELIGKEKIIATYYFKSKKAINYFNYKYQLGDYIKLKGLMIRPKNNTVFNLFNYKKYLYYNHIFYLFNIEKITLVNKNHRIFYSLKQLIDNYINSFKYSKGYIRTFVIGGTDDISSDMLNMYQQMGINHLFSISGMNVTFLSVVLISLLKKINVKELMRYIIVSLFLVIYMFLANNSPPIQRASIFFILAAINKIYYFNIKSLNIFLLTFIIVLLINPFVIYNIGFQFSFIISFCLILFQSLINKYKGYVTKLFIISLISFISSLPIVIYNFYQINIFSIVCNLFFVPYVTLILFPFAILTFILPFLDKILFLLINLMEYLSKIMTNIKVGVIILSKPSLILVLIYYIIIMYVLYMLTKGKFYTLIYLVILMFFHYISSNFNPYTSLTIIDVGQGDSILIRLPYNKGNILIDTGGKLNIPIEKWRIRKKHFSLANNTLIPYFKSFGIRKIDYLIITHGHDDHMGEALSLIKNFKIKNVILSKVSNTELEKKLINYLNKKSLSYKLYGEGDVLNINRYKFYFLNPTNYNNIDVNNNSLVIYTKINNKKILLTGDISTKIEDKIINEYKLNNLYILKVAHHGSITATSELFLDNIKPEYAIIAVGLKNKFNHPDKTVLERLNSRNISLYLTSINGSIEYRFYIKNVTIKACPS